MRSLKERRNLTAENDSELIVTKLRSLAFLLSSIDGRHFAPNEGVMYGLGLIIDDLAKELGQITESCLLYDRPTESERKENEFGYSPSNKSE